MDELIDAEQRLATPSADVWALGVTLYELFWGAAPFASDASVPVQALVAVCDAEPDFESAAVPFAVREVVRCCLSKDPRGRFSFLIGFRINGQFIHGIRISRAQLEGERGVTVGQIDLLTKYLQAAKGHEPPILAVYFTASSDESTTIVAPGDTLRDPGVCDCWVVTADPRGRPVAYQRTPQARWTRWEIEQPAEDHTHTFDNYVRRVGELDLEKA